MIFTNTASDKEEAPPPGWVRSFSKSAKRPYYLHVATKHSQWEYPSQTEVKNPTLAKKRRDDAEAEKQRAEALRQEEAKVLRQKKELMEDEKERQLQLQYQIAIQKRNEEAILSAVPASTDLNVNGKRSRSNDAKGYNQVRARSEHHFGNHSRENVIRWEPPSSSRQQHSPALEDGELIRWETTMEQRQEHRMTNISNMQLHSNEMQLSSQKDPPRYDHRMLQEPSWNDRMQQKQHPHNRPRYDHHRMPQQPSWNDRPQQKQHPHNRPRYDHHRMPQQPSWNDRPQQKQHPHNRPRYDHHRMPQQPSRNDRPQQKQHPHNRPRYDHHRMPQQPSRNDRPQQLRLHSGNAHQHDHSNDQVPWHVPPPRAQLSFHDHRHNRVTQQRPYARPQYDQVQSFRPEVRFENFFSANKLVQTAMQNFPLLDPNLISVFWNKMSKQAGKGQAHDDGEMERKLSQIFNLTQRKIGSFQPRHLSLTIHGIAKIVSVVKEGGSIRDGNCVEAALHSLLLDNAIRRGLFDTAANHIVALENLTGFSSQSLANIVWAFAKVELPQPGLFSKIAEHIVELPTQNGFVPQDIAITVWAFATAGIAHEALFDKIAHHIVELRSLNEFTPQHLSNTVWAFATAGIAHEALFHKIAMHIVELRSLNEFKPQHLSKTVWAFATAGIAHEALFDKISVHIIELRSLNEFKPQHFSNTAWAYTTAGIAHEALFDKISVHITHLPTLDEFNAQNISNTIWAFANADIPHHPQLFDRIGDHIVANTSIY